MDKSNKSDESDKGRPEPICPCGSTEKVWVHSHFQCARCGRVLSSCCEGESW